MLVFTLWMGCADVAPPPAGGPPAALVATASVRSGSLADTWTYLGDVRALERAELAAGASGTVMEVLVREGDAVDAGQLLAEVDPRLVSAELGAAVAEANRIEAELALAQRTWDRVGRVEAGVLAENERDAAESAVRSLQAGLQAARAAAQVARARRERHRIRAPFAGVVARRHIDPGDWVDPGVAVLDLVSVGAVEIRVEAPLELAQRVRVGQSAEVQGAEGSTASIVGVVPALDPVSRTAVVRLAPDGESTALVPGSAAQVAFQIEHEGGLVIPRDAVVTGVDERVFVIEEGAAKAVVVTVLASSASQVLVQADGLTEGQAVVVRGNERLRPGQPVRVSE